MVYIWITARRYEKTHNLPSIAEDSASISTFARNRYANCFEKPLSDAPHFSESANWRSPLGANYKDVFSDFVFGEIPELDEFVCLDAFILGAL